MKSLRFMEFTSITFDNEGAFLEQMPLIFAKENKKADQMKSDNEIQIENLYAEVGYLTTQLAWQK